MLVYKFEAGGTARRFMNDGPALGDLDEARPKRVLALLVDQNVVDAIFVFKRIGHVVLLEDHSLASADVSELSISRRASDLPLVRPDIIGPGAEECSIALQQYSGKSLWR
jgi:hypothetical protein